MIVILGGGLAGSLLAYRLSQMEPRPEFLLIEARDRLGGEHTWSFHKSDISAFSLSWVKDLISSSWDKQEVRFHDFKRVLTQPYYSISSKHFNRVIQAQIQNHLLLNETILKVDSNCVYLKSRKIEAQVIFDARGLDPNRLNDCGYQKFVGIDLDLENPHHLNHPVIMDTLCDQKDGYRFFYLLPWTSHSILVEDTRYSSSPDVDVEEFSGEIREYCTRQDWKINKENRVELGVLPIPFTPFRSTPLNCQELVDEIVPIGVRGGYFHWTTGYSFPHAVQVAEVISQEFKRNLNAKKNNFKELLKPLQTQLKQQSRYLSLLNRMLFQAAQPEERWKIFHRFYHLNENLIFRFYQGNLKLSDQLRILSGKPPVPILSAIKCVFKRKETHDCYG